MTNTKRLTLALVLALAITPALAGCFGNPIEQIVEGATGGDVDLPGKSIPDDFPQEVPLIDGTVTLGMGLGDAGAKAWNVTIEVSGANPADAIAAELEAAGLTAAVGTGGATEAGTTLVYESEKYTVLVVITNGSDSGFVANYTVSDKAS